MITKAPYHVPTIPVPKADVDSLYASVAALKLVVERWMRPEGPLGTEHKPAMFVQTTPPEHYRDGDFWLQSGEMTTLSISINGLWKIVGTLT